MADISITKYKTKVTKPTASPSNPGYPTSDPIDPVNPPASGAGGGGVNTFLQLTDTPATYTGQSGLFPKVNSGETGLEFFNPLSLPLTGYTVGSNTALADTDTILGSFGKVQGQINAKIGGTIASTQVAFGTGVNTVGGDAGLTWDNVSKVFDINGFLTFPKITFRATDQTSSVSEIGRRSGSILYLSQISNFPIQFDTNNTLRWSITSNGVLQSNGTQSINQSSGNLILGGVGSGVLTLNQNGAGLNTNTSLWSNLVPLQISMGSLSSNTSELDLSHNAFFDGSWKYIANGFATNYFQTGGNYYWRTAPNGIAGNTVIFTQRMRLTEAGQLWIGTNAGTNTLDVNGTARIRSVANGTGNFATYSATGVLQQRTAAEVASDIGAVTITGTQTITGVKTFSIPSSSSLVNSTFLLTSGYTGSLRTDAVIVTNSTSGTGQNLNTPALNAGGSFASIATTSGYNVGIRAISFGSSSVNIGFYGDASVSSTGNNIGFYARAGNSSTKNVSGYLTSSTATTIPTISKNTVLLLDNAIASLPYLVLQNTGSVGFEITDLFNFSFPSTNGTKIGTATTQKLAFWNATPIVQPTTAVTGATLVGGGGTTITDTDTFDGYTLAQIVKALRNIGLLA